MKTRYARLLVVVAALLPSCARVPDDHVVTPPTGANAKDTRIPNTQFRYRTNGPSKTTMGGGT